MKSIIPVLVILAASFSCAKKDVNPFRKIDSEAGAFDHSGTIEKKNFWWKPDRYGNFRDAYQKANNQGC